MKKKKANPNKGIMFGIMAMAIVVLGVVAVFWWWCFPDGKRPRTERPQAAYRILLRDGFRGDSVQLHVNDSMVFCARVESDSTEVAVAVPQGENLLMVARPERDELTSFDLPREGGRLVLQSHDGEVEMEAF